ncbi:septation protein IspZ, partial [Salmonella enterica subsp. enterica serovar Montevideo]|nr:septation protein IspZ [Salmonella enterica subsp. enterica serovar Montevideo]
ALFFIACGLANIYIAFWLPQNIWVNFKVFGLTALTLIFTLLSKNSLGIAVLLCTGLLLAGCSSNSGSGTYSGSVYTVKRGDTLY